MVTLPTIDSYSQDELKHAGRISPAIQHYLSLLNATATTPTDVLRQKRHKAWIETALSIVFEKCSAEASCYSWSVATLDILQQAWSEVGLTNEQICMISMGKLGAMELNLSSDVDLFFVSAEVPEKNVQKKIRTFIQLVSQTTPFGFGHRLDFTIRPGGTTSPVISSLDQMCNHYGNHGETWERSALIRHRVHFGTEALTKDITDFLRKFSYRRHLDLNLFGDLSLMRERIRAQHETQSVVNIKFDAGGIRELELLVHALQLIHGGKHSSVRTSSTTAALVQLGQLGLMDQQSAQLLLNTYWFYRDIENRIQLVEDQHTYDLRTTTTDFLNSTHISKFRDCAKKTDELISGLLKPYSHSTVFLNPTDLLKTFEQLPTTNEDSQQAWQKLVNDESKSKTKDRDEQQRRLFLRRFIEVLQTCNVDNSLAIFHLEKFIANSKAKASLFTLFNNYDEIVTELAWIFSCSPMISSILIHKPELIDSFLLKSVEIDESSDDTFYDTLQDHKLLAEVIAGSQFLRKRNLEHLTQTLSSTTDTIVSYLLRYLQNKLHIQMDILTLGKWAGRQMGLTSDLDFVMIRKDDSSDPPTKLARRFINFLQSPSSGSTLYSIDLRLRPSGNAGPLLSTTAELKDYLDNKAQAWERQAYLMNRLLSSNQTEALFAARPLSQEDKTLLTSIQVQLLHSNDSEILLKKSKGALLHTELVLQAACLDKKVFPETANVSGLCSALKNNISTHLSAQIESNYMLLRTFQQLLLLIGASTETPLTEENKDLQKMCLITQSTPKVVLAQIADILQQQKDLLLQVSDH
ncbi:MAG: hypothetical protein IT287_02140 [Bdellovibrionaceae bacterium]|nr:hypothetical protein [Pseudobdellovibrionaceae bacterium]